MTFLYILLYLAFFIMIALPTALFYGWPFLFAWRAYVSTSRRQAIVMLVVALAPFLLYGARYLYSYVSLKHIDRVLLAARQQAKPSPAPRTLVVHGKTYEGDAQQRLVESGAFDEIFVESDRGFVRLANGRDPNCGRYPNEFRARAGFLVCAVRTQVSAAPDDGLHLYVGLAPRQPPAPFGEQPRSRELRLISGQSRQTLALWALPGVRFPSYPPIFTTKGLMIDDRTTPTSVPDRGEMLFVVDGLGLKPEDMKPANLPSPDEVRAEFIRLSRSADAKEQRLAKMIAAAVGASVLAEFTPP
jgi:hypothetical protein